MEQTNHNPSVSPDAGNRPSRHACEGGLAGGAGLTRMDTHCHSWASDDPVMAALAFLDMPECYSPPEKVYDQARARGMDLVTITDHDTINGAMELVERGFEGFIPGEEVTVYFPEDRCKLHVLVWGLSPAQHEAIATQGLRDDIYAFAHWVSAERLAHAVAHPLYMQNGRLTRWHLERCALLFQGFEVLNGAHTARHRLPITAFLESLTSQELARLSNAHNLMPLWPDTMPKARTAGSDDHGLLNIGKTWTGVEVAHEDKSNQATAPVHAPITDPKAFFARVMQGQGVPGGQGGHSSLLAHQLTTVGAHYYAERIADHQSTRSRFIASKLLRFAGVELRRPSRTRLAAHMATHKMLRPRKGKGLPILKVLRETLEPTLAKYPDIQKKLHNNDAVHGSALSNHTQMAAFADDLGVALTRALGASTTKSLRKHDKAGITDHLLSYGVLVAAQMPYVFSLFYQNKEREFVEQFEHEIFSGKQTQDVFDRPMRVSLLTDTLGDVNGVSRFIQNVAQRAEQTGRDLQVITSTRQPIPEASNIYNFDPVFATSMPRYQNLELVLPPVVAMLRHLDAHQPDCIHISTPGPVGMVGFVAARMLRIPVLGVYHTDFPAYINSFFDDHALTNMAEGFMRLFYRPFSTVFTRSNAYIGELERLGIPKSRCQAIMPGFENELFHPRNRNQACWKKYPRVSATSVKVLYVGRVSVEKNMPMLSDIWREAFAQLQTLNINAELIVVGDGPYSKQMARDLRGTHAHFLGFQSGQTLREIYASSNLFVFPSLTDTLGQVVMESQGSGLPVLVTDKGGPAEVVEDGVTGFVLPADDTSRWVRAIVTLASDKERCQQMGAAAYKSMQQYSIDHAFEHFWQMHVQAWHKHLKERNNHPLNPLSDRTYLV